MGRDYFTILGLAPGRYEPAELARRFQAERARLLGALHDTATYADARRRLEELHLAYAALRDPQAQAEYLRTPPSERAAVTRLRQMIAAALEDGLLRYSRRQAILVEAHELGFSDFQTHLLIAQVQFGDDQIQLPGTAAQHSANAATPRAWAGFAAVGMLALALFLALVHWLGA